MSALNEVPFFNHWNLALAKVSALKAIEPPIQTDTGPKVSILTVGFSLEVTANIVEVFTQPLESVTITS